MYWPTPTSSSAVPVNPRPVSSAPSLLTNRLFVVEVFKYPVAVTERPLLVNVAVSVPRSPGQVPEKLLLMLPQLPKLNVTVDAHTGDVINKRAPTSKVILNFIAPPSLSNAPALTCIFLQDLLQRELVILFP